MPGLLATQNVVDIKNIIAVIIIIAIVLDPFTWLRQHASRVSGGLIFEKGVADAVS